MPDLPADPPAHFVYPDPELGPRSAAARALRRLGSALVRHRATEDELRQLEQTADATAHVLEQRPAVPRPSDYMARRYSDPRPVDGAEVVAFSDRPFSGPTNPMGFEVTMRRHGEAARSRVLFPAAFESAPGRAHGGAIAAAVDDNFGYLMVILGVAAYTGRLEIDYRGGVPVDEPVWFHGEQDHRDGRKLHVRLWVRPGDRTGPDLDAEPLITARGLFVLIPPERT